MLSGSPPHTRGILVLAVCKLPALRFTPAYAGNTAALPQCSSASRVHPRIRGEYMFFFKDEQATPGSPPHTRGILR